ncbi:hypothetical protein TEA_022523 [Camellia sinensis var. sinensis]|uniref:Uncharacterized protein n=1 Tax=Camellia sinensis var. sinensis TaxID=542762 RepID=A0A4S4DUY1_CAMSN|nr:hypothetical protein TEA_022523 [Camellia sinensis var. sinensis]
MSYTPYRLGLLDGASDKEREMRRRWRVDGGVELQASFAVRPTKKSSGCATHASCNLRMLTETTVVDISANLSKEWSPRRKGATSGYGPRLLSGVANSIGLPIEHDCGQVNEPEVRVNGFIPGQKLPTEAQPVIPAASESVTNGHAYTTPTMGLNPPPRTNTSTPDTVAPGGVGIPVPVVQTITPLSLSKSLLGQTDTTSVWVGKHDKLMLIRPDLGLDLPPTYYPETLTNPSPEPTQPPSPHNLSLRPNHPSLLNTQTPKPVYYVTKPPDSPQSVSTHSCTGFGGSYSWASIFVFAQPSSCYLSKKPVTAC